MRSGTYILLLVLISGCATVRMESTYDRSIDFGAYHSFCWLKGCDHKYEGDLDSLAVVEIKLAIEYEMARKGVIQDENNPQLLLDFHVWLTQEEYEKTHYSNDYDFWPAYQRESYVKGSLVIDIADSENSVMIWQSTTRKYMNPEQEPESKALRRLVRRALQDFPPEVQSPQP